MEDTRMEAKAAKKERKKSSKARARAYGDLCGLYESGHLPLPEER
jgi:hypothetical protein